MVRLGKEMQWSRRHRARTGDPFFDQGSELFFFSQKLKFTDFKQLLSEKKRMMKLIPLALTSSILLTASGFKLFDDSPRSHTLDKRNTPSWPKSAVARFIDGGVRGQVRFTQDRLDGDVSVQVDLTGLERGLHGFHVHESAITNGCVSAGGNLCALIERQISF
jgi:hypothetical protein